MTQQVKNKLQARGYILSAVLFLAGCILLFAVPGYSFSGLVLIGISVLILTFMLIFWIRKRKPHLGRVLIMILSLCLGVGFIAALITGILIWKTGKGNPEIECSYVVVLGAGVNGTEPSLSLQNRIDAAFNYLNAHTDTVCIVSGGKGSGEDISEAECMYRELTGMGIAPERIWKEDQSTTTRENLRFSLNLVEERTGSRPDEIGLITSEYHEYRAGCFAKQEGVKAVSIPARTTWVTLRINYFLREIAAVWYYVILGG